MCVKHIQYTYNNYLNRKLHIIKFKILYFKVRYSFLQFKINFNNNIIYYYNKYNNLPFLNANTFLLAYKIKIQIKLIHIILFIILIL